MRSSALAALALSMPAVGCGDGGSPTSLLPGPCSSADSVAGGQSCTMTYDDADRIDAIECLYPPVEVQGETLQDTLEWSFAWDGDRLAEIGVARFDDVESGSDVASSRHDFGFSAERVTSTLRFSQTPYETVRTEIYELDLVLARHRFETHERGGRSSDLGETARGGLVETHEMAVVDTEETTTDHTYSYDGPPHQGTRTQTRDDGVEEVFEYDDQGRLVSSTSGPELDYDGDLLVRVGFVLYEHDELGNLLRRVDGDNVTTYDYGCWE